MYSAMNSMSILLAPILLLLQGLKSCSGAASVPQSLGLNSIHRRAAKILSPIYKLEHEERERAGSWENVNDLSLKIDDEDGMDFGLLPDAFENDYEKLSDDDYEEEEEERYRTPPSQNVQGNNSEEYEDEMEEHPLRTDEWLVKVTMSPLLLPRNREVDLFPDSIAIDDEDDAAVNSSSLKRNRFGVKQKGMNQVLKFSKNGYVILIEDSNDCTGPEYVTIQKSHSSRIVKKFDEWVQRRQYVDIDTDETSEDSITSRRVTKIGKWKMGTNGVSWSMPVRVESDDSPEGVAKTTTLHYHADIHLSKFQEQPRMFKGVVTRDRFPGIGIRKDLFRPVIATFTAEGIGEDTADISYKKRGFGLKGGNS